MLLTPHTGIGQQFLHIEQSTLNTIDRVFTVTITEERARHGDLCEVEGQNARRVVESQHDFGATKWRALCRAIKDDVFHLLASHRRRSLCTKHPSNGVNNIGLTRTIRTDDNSDAWFHFHHGGISEGLKAFEGKRFQKHSENNSNRDGSLPPHSVSADNAGNKPSNAPPP
ncbi:unannotated protein [freshwater metagenome]|uniref:Unannotated protein n=1 Tax=freshwater metagenome TaxID=449393 RepID=A0A6J6KWU1_9ZZZZ